MLSKQQQKSLLIVLAFSLIISVMNGTMFNIVLPNIREEFALSSVLMGWFSSSFLIVYAISTAIYGKCTERFSLKTLLIFAFIVLLIADILGYLGQNYASMLLARVLQAIGTAIIPDYSCTLFCSGRTRLCFWYDSYRRSIRCSNWPNDCWVCCPIF